MTRRLSALVFALWLVPAATAFAQAHDNGEGLAGETDDKLVTFFGLGVVAFFAIFVIVATLLQQSLEKRKERQKAARLRQRTGW